MTTFHHSQSKENKSNAIANNFSGKTGSSKTGFQSANAHPGIQTAPAQLMTRRGANVASVVQADKVAKHVVAGAAQQAHADANHGNLTLVTNQASITAVVDADAHNFADAAAARSARHDINANVAGVSVYEKAPNFPFPGSPTARTVNNANTPCEIGVVKKGDDTISVTHFQAS